MELILFCGLQGAGKSHFYAQHLLQSHLRLSRDLLKTEARQRSLYFAALALGQRVVLDNTHLSRASRAPHIRAARGADYRVVGVYFDVPLALALARNAGRCGRARVPDRAILGAAKKLEAPTPEEGFDALFRIEVGEHDIRVHALHDPEGRGLIDEAP